jgi:hypothetical protein
MYNVVQPFPKPKQPWRRPLILIASSLVFYVLACAYPALIFRRSSSEIEVWSGFRVLTIGWLGLLVGQIAWYANPVIVLSLLFVLLRRWGLTLVVSGASLLIAANTFLLFHKELPADEGSVVKLRLERLGFGFFFWLASIFAIVVGAILLRRQDSVQSR